MAKRKASKPKVGIAKPKKLPKLNVSWRLIILGVMAAAALLDLAFSFVPSSSVPDALRPLHNQILALRNTAIAKSGLPVSRYDDTAVLTQPDAPPIKLYFAPSPKIDKGLCDFIDQARASLFVCIYDLDLQDVADSLIRASKRGVAVRVVTDSDNYRNAAVQSLLRAGMPVHQDNRKEIMHNKFVVLDSKRLWTGSYNFTSNCTFKNDNNAIALDSEPLAEFYEAKFDEYWDGMFGQSAPRTSAQPKACVGSIPVTAMFSPSDGVLAKILDELSTAESSVDMMAFSFTSKEIAAKLRSLSASGVKVRCLFDGSQAENPYSKDDSLKKAGIKVKISPNHAGRMHHKVIIIDGRAVITGSYNFSGNAEMHNDENVLIIDSKDVAAKYGEEFQRCWDGVKGY